jgi:hypothetical protein
MLKALLCPLNYLDVVDHKNDPKNAPKDAPKRAQNNPDGLS